LKNEADMKRIIIILLTIASCFAVAGASGVENKSKPAVTKNTYALIICGINKDPKERLSKDKAVTNLRSFFLNNAKLKPARLCVLVPDKSFVVKDSKTSNAENLKETIKNLAATVQPEDRFIFYYIGQANVVAGKLRLNLPGQDITHEQLTGWINQIKASSMLLVLDCPGAGMAVKALTGQGRIVIGACTAEQHYSTRFSEYFIPSLLDSKSDTDDDGKISLLEAFTFASKQLDDWYFSQLFLKTETPVLEDNADGFPSRQPWRYKQDNTDGREASKFFLSEE
jgi:hypothetical protein